MFASPLIPAALLLFTAQLSPAQTAPQDPAAKKVPGLVENQQHQVEPYRRQALREGIAVNVAVDHVNPVNKTPGYFTEGDQVRIRFMLSETAGGSPLRNAYPAAWLDLNPPEIERKEQDCLAKLKSFLGGGLLGAAEINLNEYYVVTLNNDATLSVVDPLFGFGGSKLLALITLESPGADWAGTENQAQIFVSQPDSDKVAVVDTASWRVRRQLKIGPRPVRTKLQPNQRNLWVSLQGREGASGGIAVINLDNLEEVARLETAGGIQDIVFDHDSRFAYVANRKSGILTVIDTARLEPVAKIELEPQLHSITWSDRAKAVYAAHQNGTISIIDGQSHQLTKTLKTKHGLSQIAFERQGRYAFAVNPQTDALHIIDAVKQRIVQSATLLDQPNQINFSDDLGYISHAGSETVLMVPLAEIGTEGKEIAVVDMPGGQAPPGLAKNPSRAAGIVQAPGANAVLIANPADQCVYYFKEGMAAPMGQFQNYDRAPRAVRVVDNSLKEHHQPGVYETFVKLEKPGLYDMVLFMDSPRLAECFPLKVNPDPLAQTARSQNLSTVTFQSKQRIFPVGGPISMDFAIHDPTTGLPRAGLEDVQVLVNLMPGIWHHRYPAVSVGEGVYRIQFKPPRRGVYHLIAASQTANLSFNNADYFVMRAGPPRQPKPTKPNREQTPKGNGP